MKKYILLLIICTLIFFQKIYSQSISLYSGHPYYFMNSKGLSESLKYENCFNYSAGFLLNGFIKSLKVGIGFGYSSKNYIYTYDNKILDPLKIKYKLNYYNISLIIEPKIYTDKKNTISILGGFYFIFPFSYYSQNLLSKETKDWEKLNIRKDHGEIFKISVKYYRLIVKDLYLFADVYYNYKYRIDIPKISIMPEIYLDCAYYPLTNDKHSIGINVGIEWVFFDKFITFFKKKLKYENNL